MLGLNAALRQEVGLTAQAAWINASIRTAICRAGRGTWTRQSKSLVSPWEGYIGSDRDYEQMSGLCAQQRHLVEAEFPVLEDAGDDAGAKEHPRRTRDAPGQRALYGPEGGLSTSPPPSLGCTSNLHENSCHAQASVDQLGADPKFTRDHR